MILLDDSVACRVSGSISRNGVAVATNSVEVSQPFVTSVSQLIDLDSKIFSYKVYATQSASLILDVPPDTTGAAAAATAATNSAANVADSQYRGVKNLVVAVLLTEY